MTPTSGTGPEQVAWLEIDKALGGAGWMVQMMRRFRLSLFVVAYVFAAPAQLLGQGVDVSTLTREEQEEFLRTAEILSTEQIGIGVTLAQRATLSTGTLTHDAQIQCVDVLKAEFRLNRRPEYNFRDSYKFNTAAYLLDKLLGLNMIPVSVERPVKGKSCAVTWWVDDVIMDEKTRRDENARAPDPRDWALQRSIVNVFDQLISNTDRNEQNLLISKDWKLWMIDHTRAFRTFDQLRNPTILEWCDRVLLDRLRALDEDTLLAALGGSLTRWEIQGLAARARLIVKHFDDRSAERGEGAVLFDWLQP